MFFQGLFPKGCLLRVVSHVTISQVATPQMCDVQSGKFPKADLGIGSLGICTFGKLPLGKIPFEKHLIIIKKNNHFWIHLGEKTSCVNCWIQRRDMLQISTVFLLDTGILLLSLLLSFSFI